MNNNTDQLFSQITATQADITRSISLLAAMVSGLTDKLESLQEPDPDIRQPVNQKCQPQV